MKVYACFIFGIKENDNLEETLELYQFINKLEKYTYSSISYRMPTDNILFIQAKELAKKYSNIVNFDYSLDAKYDKKDFEKAVAYVPEFKRVCWEYDDSDVFGNDCGECGMWDQTGDLEIKPQGSIKKYRDEYATFVNEGAGTPLISVKLYEYLCENGIDKKYLRPVYSKRDKLTPIAYQLYSDFVLPAQVVKYPQFEIKEKCEKCGRIQLLYSEPEEFSPMTISREAVSQLQPVNMPSEYLVHFKQTIVSKQMYQLIIEKDPKARFEPIFLEE